MNWIPITDPKAGVAPWDGTPVLIATDHAIDRVHRAVWEDGLWMVEDRKHGPFALRGFRNVTHWMPLPAPPDTH